MKRGFVAHVLPWVIIAALALWHFTVPVVAFMGADSWVFTPDEISARVTGRKIRNCDFISGSEAGYMRVNGQWIETPFAFRADPSPGSSRPTGSQAFGVWAWGRSGERPDSVMLQVKHLCDGQTVTTQVGPFSIPWE